MSTAAVFEDAQEPSVRRQPGGDLAIMLTGGGARAAYQVGLLRGIARHFPNQRFQIVTGVSAGAINAMFLAAHQGSLGEKSDQLTDLWMSLRCESIYQFDWTTLLPFRSALSSIFWRRKWTRPHGFVNTAPLAALLGQILHAIPGQPIRGVIENLRAGHLHAVALMTLDYSTGQSVRWVQGRNFDAYEAPNTRNQQTQMTIEHVLASAALPFVFPAVKIGTEWHGDGGIRLAAPLSPAVHLGARRIIAMSTGYQRTAAEADTPVVRGYPPAAQLLGQLMNAVFLDVIDEDVMRMERMNEMLRKLNPHDRDGLRPIDLLVLRPSINLGTLAGELEADLPLNLKLLTRALGAKEIDSPDLVSLLMFTPAYTQRLIELGEADVEQRIDELRDFLGEPLTEVASL